MAGADELQLHGLRVMSSVGVLPEERARHQPLEVDVTVRTDLSKAGQSDALGDTIDYGRVAQAIVDVCAAQHYDLLERMAQVVADVVLQVHRVDSVSVAVRKLRPPVPHDLATAGVHITRSSVTAGLPDVEQH